MDGNMMANLTPAVEIQDYITPQALDALYVLEGHYKGPEKPKSYKGKLDKTTTYYGMTDAGLATIRSSKLKLPDWLRKAKAETLTKEQAREAAGYLAAAHTDMLDRAFEGDNQEFSRLPLAWRSAILTLAHSNGVNGWIKSYKDGNRGSLLQAIKTGDREVICRYMMAKEDGSIMDEPHGSPKSGRINRVLSAVKLMYDTEAKAFKDAKTKDATFKRWTDNEFTVRNVQNHLYQIHLANLRNADYEKDMRDFSQQNLLLKPTNDKDVINDGTVQAPTTPQPEKLGVFGKVAQFANDLTAKAKNLFTKNEETANVTNGNKDVNMQQGSSTIG